MAKKETDRQLEGTGRRKVFLNEYVHALDPKKRLTVPREWRKLFSGEEEPQLCVMPSPTDDCLLLGPLDTVLEKWETLFARDLSDPVAAKYRRNLGRRSQNMTWDTAGRIRIKDELLAKAALSDDVVMVGAVHFVELWNPQKLDEADGDMDDAAMNALGRQLNV